MKKNVIGFISGLLFALGLCVSQMVNPNKVLAFLDIAGDWDPSLIFVMLGAISITAVCFRLAIKRGHPVYDKQFYLSEGQDIDVRLVLGAIIFGIGWGLIGYCPGPIVTSLGFGVLNSLVVFAALLVGMLIWGLLAKRLPN